MEFSVSSKPLSHVFTACKGQITSQPLRWYQSNKDATVKLSEFIVNNPGVLQGLSKEQLKQIGEQITSVYEKYQIRNPRTSTLPARVARLVCDFVLRKLGIRLEKAQITQLY